MLYEVITDVAATDEFAADIQLRDRRPVGENLHPLANLRLFEHVDAEKQRQVARLRITSYNVCYTKLLRRSVWLPISGWSSSTISPGKSAMVISQAAARAAATRNVITSYSIHYTKLYDRSDRALAVCQIAKAEVVIGKVYQPFFR